MCSNEADGIANSIDPDQTAPKGAAWLGFTPFFHDEAPIIMIQSFGTDRSEQTVFGIFDQVRLNPVCSATETS